MTVLTSDQIADICTEDPRLHQRHYSVFNRIARWARSGMVCFESQREMGIKLGLSEKTIKRHIDALVAAGRIAYRQRPNSSNVYELLSHTDKKSESSGHDVGQYKELNEKYKIKSTEPTKPVDQKDVEQKTLSYQDMVEQFTVDSEYVKIISATYSVSSVKAVLSAFIERWRGCSAYYRIELKTWLSKLEGWFKNRQAMDIENSVKENVPRGAQKTYKSRKKRHSFLELARGNHLKNMPVVPNSTLDLMQRFDALRLSHEN